MAITETLLTAGTGTTSASISPSANTLVEIEVITQAFSGNLAPTVTASGNSLTYVEVTNVLNGASGTISTRTTRFRGMGASPTSGAVTFSTSGSSLKNLIHSIKSVSGTDTSGTNGSGAYVQTVTNNTDGSGAPNTLTLTLAAYADAVNNAGSVAFANDQGDAATPDTGYTEVSDTQVAGEIGLQAQYKTPGTTSIVSTAYTAFANIGGIASELKAAAAGGTIYTRTLSDSVAVIDTPVRGAYRGRVPSESIAVLDTLIRGQLHGRTLHDDVTLTDALREMVLAYRKITETITVTDALTSLVISYVIYLRTLQDGIAVRDDVSRQAFLTRLNADVVAVLDNLQRNTLLYRRLLEAVETGDVTVSALTLFQQFMGLVLMTLQTREHFVMRLENQPVDMALAAQAVTVSLNADPIEMSLEQIQFIRMGVDQ